MRPRRHALWGITTTTALVVTMAPAALAAGHAETLVAFDPEQGRLPEGVAVDAEGNVYASLTTIGEVVKIPAGSSEAEPFAVIEGLAEGEFGPVGLAVDAEGNVYSGAMSANPELNGAWRFDAATGEATRIAGSEGIAFANDVDLADDGTLYVTDTIAGAVWRATPDGAAELWIEHELLAGTGEAGFGFPIGANGIAVDGDTVYVGVTEKAHVVAVPVEADGSAGEPTLYAQLPEAVDGIDIDAAGNLVSTHPLANLITRLHADGELEIIAGEADGLDRPSTIALQPNDDGSTTAYVANFSIAMGTELGNGPSILRLQLGGPDAEASTTVSSSSGSSGIASSVVKAPIVPDGDVAGAPADFVINLDSDMDPAVEGRTLLAGNTIRITLPEDFVSAGLPADVPTQCAAFAGECNTAVLLQGWPQRPFPPTPEFYTLEMDGTHTLVFTAVQDLAPGATPGLKQSHLMALGFTNPQAGDYAIEVEAQTGPGGEVETGTAVVTIHPQIRPSINVTSIFAKVNDDDPNGNTIYQQASPGGTPPFAWDFLLWGADGTGIVGAELVQTGAAGGDIVVGDETIGSFSIDAPEGATGQSLSGGPSVAFDAPVSGAPTSRLTAAFTAGDTPGTYVTTFELDGGNAQRMYVEVAE